MSASDCPSGANGPSPQKLWSLAHDEARAAAVISADPMVGDASIARVHFLASWRFLIGSQCDGALLEDGELSDWLRGGRLPQLRAKDQEAAAAAVQRIATNSGDLPVRWFRSQIRRLEQVVGDVGADVVGWSSRRERQLRWIWRGVAGAVGLVLVVSWALLWRDALAPGRWRGTYFPAKDFAGQPATRRDRDVNFDWGNGRPMAKMPDDYFSVRWDSCLVVVTPTTAAFQIISNNGSRLFVDGELAVDNWDNNFTRTRGGEFDLSAGVHHLRVEYWEGRRSAGVTLLASLDGDPPRAIPRSWLRYPNDSDSPCRTQ